MASIAALWGSHQDENEQAVGSDSSLGFEVAVRLVDNCYPQADIDEREGIGVAEKDKEIAMEQTGEMTDVVVEVMAESSFDTQMAALAVDKFRMVGTVAEPHKVVDKWIVDTPLVAVLAVAAADRLESLAVDR